MHETAAHAQIHEVMLLQAGGEEQEVKKKKKRGLAKGGEDNLRAKRGKTQVDIKEGKKKQKRFVCQLQLQ